MLCKSIINFNTGDTCNEEAMNTMHHKSKEYPLCERHYEQYNQKSIASEIEPGILHCKKKPRGVLDDDVVNDNYSQGLYETIELHKPDDAIDRLHVNVPEYLKPIHQYARKINREEAEEQTFLEPFIIDDSSYEIVEESNEEDILSNYANRSDISGPLKSDETIDYIGKTLGKIAGIPDFIVEGLLSSLKEDEVLRQARYSIESKKSFLSMNPLLKIHPDDSSYLIILKRIGQIVLNKWLNLMNSRSATTVIETKTLTRPTQSSSNTLPNPLPREVSINLSGLMNKTNYTIPNNEIIEINNAIDTNHHTINETPIVKSDDNATNTERTTSQLNRSPKRTGLMDFLNSTSH